jgi:hypothetical protein
VRRGRESDVLDLDHAMAAPVRLRPARVAQSARCLVERYVLVQDVRVVVEGEVRRRALGPVRALGAGDRAAFGRVMHDLASASGERSGVLHRHANGIRVPQDALRRARLNTDPVGERGRSDVACDPDPDVDMVVVVDLRAP